MSLPQYPTYKDSGVEWQGDVPEHWQHFRNKTIFSDVDERSTDEEGELLTVSHLTGVTPRADKDVNMFLAETFVGYKTCQPGDLVINTMWAWMGALGTARCAGLVSPSYNVYRPRNPDVVLPDFYDFLCRSPSHCTIIKSRSTGVWESRLRLYPQAFLAMTVCLPPLDEQKAISSFLDVETSKIDGLVSEQRRLIELLKEKRQAVMSHAVTKGLNPNAPMKPSGIQWLGDVPQHWKLVKLKLLTQIGNGSTPDRKNLNYWTDGTYPWLNSSVVNEATVTEASQFVTELALEECHLPKITPPAVLVGITGQGRTRGMATILDMEATINQHVAYLKPLDGRTTVSFIHRFFQMAYNYIRDESEGAGSTKGAITCGQLEKLKMPLPPNDELTEITKHLDAETESLTQLEAEAERAIELLQERRTALISAAVTGKIDVREFAYQETA